MSQAFHRVGNFLLLAVYPLFVGFVYFHTYVIPGIANVLGTTTAMVTAIVYLHTKLSHERLLGVRTRHLFISLAASSLTMSAISLLLGYSLVNVFNVAVCAWIIYECYNRFRT